jgi:Transmembrane protein 131-like N-terminal
MANQRMSSLGLSNPGVLNLRVLNLRPRHRRSLPVLLYVLAMLSFTCAAASAQCTRCGSILLVSPSTLNFGSESVGAGKVMSIFIRAEGTFPATGITITKTGAPAFSQTNTCPAELKPNQACRVSVTFAPRHTGPLSGEIVIHSSAGTHMVALSGTGVK